MHLAGVCACRRGNLTSVCSERAQQCKVNPVTVCRVHLRQEEAAGSMQGHADLMSNTGGEKKNPFLVLHIIMEDNKMFSEMERKMQRVGQQR